MSALWVGSVETQSLPRCISVPSGEGSVRFWSPSSESVFQSIRGSRVFLGLRCVMFLFSFLLIFFFTVVPTYWSPVLYLHSILVPSQWSSPLRLQKDLHSRNRIGSDTVHHQPISSDSKVITVWDEVFGDTNDIPLCLEFSSHLLIR
jgi:hypothetical protein